MTTAPPSAGHPHPRLGSRVRARRKELGLTLKEVSAGTGISVPFLSQIETGKHVPSLGTLFRLHPVLRTSVEWLLGSAAPGPVSLVRADGGERSDIAGAEGRAVRRRITSGEDPFAVSEYVVEPGAPVGGPELGSGRQVLFVLAGRLAVELEVDGAETTYELGPGDSLCYDVAIRHHWRQVGRRRARFVAIMG